MAIIKKQKEIKFNNECNCIVDYGYRVGEFNILDVDVSYSDDLMQIQITEIIEK